MNTFVSFMATPTGRIIRVVAGVGLMAWGLLEMGGINGYIVAGVGALPLLTGAFNICIFGPLLGSPLSGSKVRTANG